MSTISERLNSFLSGIDSYIAGKNFTGAEFNEQFKEAEKLDAEAFDALTRDECFMHSFMLYQYADSVATELARHKSVVTWCDNAMTGMIGAELVNMPQIAKHEMKLAAILRENNVANSLNDWRIAAQARVDFLTSKETLLRKKAECLMEKGKRK